VGAQGEAYAAYVQATLNDERERAKVLSERAAATTTTSSAFVGLVHALAVLLTGKDYAYTGAAAAGLLVGLLAFAVATLLGFVANLSRTYEVAAIETMSEMTTTRWTDSDVDARNTVAYVNLNTVKSLRDTNATKARCLKWALGVQLSGVVVVIITLALQLPAVVASPGPASSISPSAVPTATQ
jgi:hypothetical protein